MDLLKLKYFYTTAKYEHVTKAAEELLVAQPAVTKTIKQLESELGVELFEKKGRNIVLTECGSFLKSKLDGVFSIIDALPQEFEKIKNQSQKTIRVNVLAASIFVLETVLAYKNAHPEIIFNMIQYAEWDKTDIQIRTVLASEFKPISNENTFIIQEELLLAVSTRSKYANEKTISLKDLREEKFIYLAGSKAYRYICDSFFKQAKFKPNISFETDSVIAVKNIIGVDAGVGFWPEKTWGKIDYETVKLIPVTDVDCKRYVVVEINENSANKKHVLEFFNHIVGMLKILFNQ